MDFAKLKWLELGADETWFDIIPESSFTVAVAEKAARPSQLGPRLRAHQIRIVEWDDMSVTKLSELITGSRRNAPELFYSMSWASCTTGSTTRSRRTTRPGYPDVWVTNERGDGPWSAPG